jgi:hypothetical protein
VTDERPSDRSGPWASRADRARRAERRWFAGFRLWAREGRLVALVALCAYSGLLGLSSLERVPLPEPLAGVNDAAGGAAGLLREVSIIPGPALFYDLDETSIGVLTNCVVITAVSADGSEQSTYTTSTCEKEAEASLLSGPLDKALVRLEFDALVFRTVPATGSPTSGDRILAAIGHWFCGRSESESESASGGDGDEPGEVAILWVQAAEDRRDGSRRWVTRSLARWSCQEGELLRRQWSPLLEGSPS